MELTDIDFSVVRNRNEKRVLKALGRLLDDNRGRAKVELLDVKDFQDIYALALNQLPARYAQPGTIVVGDPVRDDDALRAVMDAYETVANRPKV